MTICYRKLPVVPGHPDMAGDDSERCCDGSVDALCVQSAKHQAADEPNHQQDYAHNQEVSDQWAERHARRVFPRRNERLLVRERR
jgi:hypothetical protein